ncbi:Serine/threonine-protein phosphatase [Aphelenchoides fujianensis]|nr:Serine/threonine-protein phosphatase [Aphelenchoides fujianensis]
MRARFLLAALLLVAVARADEEFTCWTSKGESLPLDEEPDSTQGALVHKDDTCCVTLSVTARTLRYFVATPEERTELKLPEPLACSLADVEKATATFTCCCATDWCNSQAFALWSWQETLAPFESSVEEFLPLIVGLAFLGVMGAVSYLTLEWCVVQRYRGRAEFQAEMPPEFYANLRGTKVLPYLTKAETRLVVEQLRRARSTAPAEVRAIRRRPRVVGVYTYSTTATTTNRELGAVLLGQPAAHEPDPFFATLVRMIEVGPREVRFEAPHLLQIIEKAESVFKQEPTLLEVFRRFMQCFTYIPLAARIGRRALAMHGGLSPKLESLADIQARRNAVNPPLICCLQAIPRPVHFVNGTLACDLVWSDPHRGTDEYEVNYNRDRRNGMGYLFGQRQVHEAAAQLGVELFVRGHQAPMGGYELFADGRLVTIFSSPGYRTSSDLETNFGASLHVAESGELLVTRIGVDNHVRLLRDLQKLDKAGDGCSSSSHSCVLQGEAYSDMDKLVLKPSRGDDDGSF